VIVDHRTYTFRPGTVQKWIKKYVSAGLPVQRRYLGRMVGFYTTQIGNLHQVVLIWEYESLADMEARRARMADDPEWKIYLDEVWAMSAIEIQDTKILKPIPLS
jgi:hypothetical protein